MPETETIQVMGRGANVDFTIDDTVPYETAVQGLRSYLSECNGLYSRGTISVNVGRRILEAGELSGIKRILDQESGLTVSRYWCAPEIIEEALRRPPPAAAPAVDPEEAPVGENDAAAVEQAAAVNEVPAVKAAPDTCQAGRQLALLLDGASADPAEKEADTAAVAVVTDTPAEPAIDRPEAEQSVTNPEPAGAEIEETPAAIDPAAGAEGLPAEEGAFNPYRGAEALIIKTTCRSGEVIRYPGDVVALADVNPGAEIIADGDIVVFGKLRGLAHAGAAGDLKATIIALNLDAPRVQIGPHIGEAPRSVRQSKASGTTPQVAYVRRRSIFVAPFTRRQEEYQGGILYEG